MLANSLSLKYPCTFFGLTHSLPHPTVHHACIQMLLSRAELNAGSSSKSPCYLANRISCFFPPTRTDLHSYFPLLQILNIVWYPFLINIRELLFLNKQKKKKEGFHIQSSLKLGNNLELLLYYPHNGNFRASSVLSLDLFLSTDQTRSFQTSVTFREILEEHTKNEQRNHIPGFLTCCPDLLLNQIQASVN